MLEPKYLINVSVINGEDNLTHDDRIFLIKIIDKLLTGSGAQLVITYQPKLEAPLLSM